MAIEEVTSWSTTARNNQAVHPPSREGERAPRISKSFQELQAAIARWRDTLSGGGGSTSTSATKSIWYGRTYGGR